MLLASVQIVRQDLDAANVHLLNARHFAEKDALVHKLRDVAALEVTLLIARGDIDGAAFLVQEFDLPLQKAEVYLAQRDASAALKIVEGSREETLHAMLLKAIAIYRLGDEKTALEMLEKALNLTRKSAMIRSYVDCGDAMAALLQGISVQGELNIYLHRIQDVFGLTKNISSAGLIEPLSERELEILQLIAQGLSNREISERLYLALDTVKGHNRKIFSKLQVQRRTEAVARVRELGLM